MHQEAVDFCQEAAGFLSPGDVIELGACNVNGSARDLIPHTSWLGIDRQMGPGVNILADFVSMDWRWDELFDLAVSTEAFEHCQGVAVAVDRMVRSVKTGGHVLITCATDPRGPHGCGGGPVGDEWYRNVEPEVLEHPQLVPVIERVDRNVGDLYLLARVERRLFG